MKYYVAYGSNLNIKEMYYRCPNAKVVGTSFINDYELLFKGSKTGSYLTIEKRKGSKVPVAIWEINDSDEINLDIYEDYPQLYYKTDITLKVTDIKQKWIKDLDCFVYIMHEERELSIPTINYLDVCEEGYKDFGFDIEYLREAYFKSGGNEK